MFAIVSLGDFLPNWATLLVGVTFNRGAEHKANDGGELHHDIKRWARGILKRVAHGVTCDRVLVCLAALAMFFAKTTRRDVLFGIIPWQGQRGTTRTLSQVTPWATLLRIPLAQRLIS